MELLTIVHADTTELIPIIYEFMGRVERHILFYDKANYDKAFASELKSNIENLNKKYGFSVTIKMIEINEDSKKDMERIAKAFEGNRENLYLNGAGADTALFTVLSSIVLRQNGKVIAYDREENNYNLITANGFTNEKIEHNMNIEDFLILMGDELLDECDKGEIIKRKEALELLFGDTKRLFKVRYLLKTRKTKELQKRYAKVMEALKSLQIVDKNNRINGQEGFVRFGYLFEEYVYLQLEGFDFDDIKVGAKIGFDKGQIERKKITVANEFDILLIKNNKIGFIECKMGDSSDPLGTIYKSDSIMDYFGASASSMIVNIERDKTPHLKRSKRNFGDALLLRAKSKKVTIYNAFDFSKPTFRAKVSEAFGIELKEAFKKQNSKEQISQLQAKLGGL